MTAPTLPSFVDSSLARRLELGHAWRSVRYAEAYQRLHPEAQCAVLPLAGGYAIYVAPGSPLNSAVGLGMGAPFNAGDMAALADFFASRGEPLRIHACPFADDSLYEQLRRGRFTPGGFFSVLYRPLPDDFTSAPLPPEMMITHARPEQAELWLDVVARGFEEADTPSPAALDILGPNFHAEDSAAYFAWIDGRPAAGGGVYLNPAERVFELGGAATLPPYRRRGAQRALIDARMDAALQRGCDLALVLTEPGSDSQRNLQRAGFYLAYTNVVLAENQ